MGSFRISCVFLLISMQGHSVMAATEFEDSIPLDVAEALFDFGVGGRFTVYSDIMDGFPVFQLPSEFMVLGSTFYNNSMRVALSTELAEEQAVQTIEDSFASDGWVTMPNFNPRRNRAGFVSANQVEPQYRSICHDQFGQMSISSRPRSPVTFIVLSLRTSLSRNWTSCAQLRAQQEQQMVMLSGRVGFQQYMPRLVVPEEANSERSPGFALASSSSSNNRAESEISLEIDWNMEEVYLYFAEQMQEQDWDLDTESIGSVSASGTWTQSPEDNMNLIGTLNVVNLGENRFQLKLSVEAPGGNLGIRILRSNQ